MSEKYDYIIVGGGSSGCAAAARLVKEAGARVLLLEAGHSHRHPLLDMPPGIFKMINGSKFMRYHHTVPQEHLNGRVHDIPQGNVLGGGSSVNAQVYMRGRPSDYDEWDTALRGDNDYPGWSWADVLPHFRAMEGNNRLCDERHGADGPVLVSDPGHIDDVSRWFVQSVQALGEPYNHDFNGPKQRGVGFYQFTNRRGKRSSAAYAFIAPLEGNPNLTIRLGAKAQRILIDKGRAIGIAWRDANGAEQQAFADGEVIVAAGALVTPQLLMLSASAPPIIFARMGSIASPISWNRRESDRSSGSADHRNRQRPVWLLPAGRRLAHVAQRPAVQAVRHGTDHLGRRRSRRLRQSDRPEADPTIQAFCVPIVYLDRDALGHVADTYGMTITTVVVKPKSRGFVRLASADPDDMPLVSPHLLKDPADMRAMVDGQRFFLRAFQSGDSPNASAISSRPIPPISATKRS